MVMQWHIAGIPNELIEDSKFVPLSADDPKYGPPVISNCSFNFPMVKLN